VEGTRFTLDDLNSPRLLEDVPVEMLLEVETSKTSGECTLSWDNITDSSETRERVIAAIGDIDREQLEIYIHVGHFKTSSTISMHYGRQGNVIFLGALRGTLPRETRAPEQSEATRLTPRFRDV
jgi:hypothetical protein